METIIKCAIEGGYTKGKAVMNELTDTIYLRANPEMFFLDPLFWQALGKACGWEKQNHCPTCGDIVGGLIPPEEYYSQQFFYRNLTEGWEKAVEYLESIISSKI